VLTTTYLINRMTNKALQNQIPLELLYGRPPYEHLKVFGCLCYMSTLKHGRDKFQARVIPCVFLGYSYGKKAYKVMDIMNMFFLSLIPSKSMFICLNPYTQLFFMNILSTF